MAGTDNTAANSAQAPAMPSAIQFSCPACGGQLAIRAPGLTVSVYCTHCCSELDAVNSENVRLLQKLDDRMAVKPLIAIGQRGSLQGIEWEVIGFMQRSSSGYAWGEYLLFNPKNGFRWLLENQGHWTLYRNIKHKVEAGYSSQGRTAVLQGKTYKLFDKCTAKVDFVLGEFYWRVHKGETSQTEDYIRPPFMLSHETNSNGRQAESLWSLGEYVPHTTIREAFQANDRLRWPVGTGANQPNHYNASAKELMFYGVIFSCLLGLFSWVLSFTHERQIQTLVTQHYHGDSTTGSLSGQISPTFTVKDQNSRLDFLMSSNVDNSWSELQVDLVNEDTGQVLQLEQGTELWSGQDSDGAWVEGGSSSQRKLTRVPAGHYHLDADFVWQGNPANRRPEATLTVTTGTSSSMLFWLGILLLFSPGLFFICAGSIFETQRWANSPYNPYDTE